MPLLKLIDGCDAEQQAAGEAVELPHQQQGKCALFGQLEHAPEAGPVTGCPGS